MLLRLRTVGDSLTHGMSSGAVFRTDLSWPALVAAGLGIPQLTVATYGGPLGGLPFNLEGVLRQLQKTFGEDLNILEDVAVPVAMQRLGDDNEDYWERGDGSKPPRVDLRYENVGIYGWDVRDGVSYTAGRAAQRSTQRPRRTTTSPDTSRKTTTTSRPTACSPRSVLRPPRWMRLLGMAATVASAP
jgi:hypothetical protein